MNDDKYLVVLHKIAPLSKIRQYIIKQKIKKQLQIDITSRINNYIKGVGVSIIAVFIAFFTLTSNAEIVILSAEESGWEAMLDMDRQQISISAVNPAKIQEDEVCVLWLENGSYLKLLALLPDDKGKKLYIDVDDDVMKNFSSNSSIKIAIHKKNQTTTNGNVVYSTLLKM